MQRSGTIVRFDAARGFGFLHSAQSPADVFFHVRDFDRHAGPPAVGMAVDFEEIHVGGKGPRAMAVRPAGRPARASTARPAGAAAVPRHGSAGMPPRDGATQTGGPTASLPLFLLAAMAELGLLGWCIAQGRLPVILPVAGVVLNLATFWIYWHDKHSARQQTWRVRETTLHLLSLAGGWPAAWWAQQLLRHKSRKPAFRTTYAATVLVHLALLAVYGAHSLHGAW